MKQLRGKGQAAPGLLTDSLHFLFNHQSLRDVLPSIYHAQKKFRCSISLRDEGLGSGIRLCVYICVCLQNVDTGTYIHTHSNIHQEVYKIVSDCYVYTVHAFVFLCVWYTGFTGHGLLLQAVMETYGCQLAALIQRCSLLISTWCHRNRRLCQNLQEWFSIFANGAQWLRVSESYLLTSRGHDSMVS